MWYHKGNVLQHLHRYPAAVEAYDQAWRLDPDSDESVDYLIGYGEALQAQGSLLGGGGPHFVRVDYQANLPFPSPGT
jgi:tetratricopeptide (TPR) repeat protein